MIKFIEMINKMLVYPPCIVQLLEGTIEYIFEIIKMILVDAVGSFPFIFFSVLSFLCSFYLFFSHIVLPSILFWDPQCHNELPKNVLLKGNGLRTKVFDAPAVHSVQSSLFI
jgi:hypothetical protein